MPAFQDYRRLFEQSPTPMFVYATPGYRFLAVNESALVQYGYTREAFLQLTALDIRPESEIPAFLNANTAIPESYSHAGKFLHRRSDARTFPVQIYTRKTVFLQQEAVLVLAHDIEDQVRAETELQAQKNATETILESITDGFFTLDRNWRFLYVNKETEKVTGLSREQLVGKNAWELFPGGKDSRFFQEYSRVFNEKISVHFEEFFPDLSIWTQVNAYPAGEGIAVYFRDSTASKKAEEQIFNERQNLMAIINNTRDIIWSVDRDNRIISANTAFWNRVSEIVGKPVGDLSEGDYDLESYAAWVPYFQAALQGETFTIVREEKREEKTVFEEVSFNPIYDRDGGVSGVSCFLRDITAQREYIQKIESQNEQFKKIAWMQSHHIRNHVANILGLISLIEIESTEGKDELMRKMRISATLLDDVIKEINALSNEGKLQAD